MRFEEKLVGGNLIAKILDQRVAADTAMQLKQQIQGYADKGHKSIVLDISAVTFIDSSGLGALISGLKAVGQSGTLVITGTQDSVMNAFRLTRLDRVFRMYATADDAIATLA